MSEEFHLPHRSPHRFVPTLTEVVPHGLAGAAATSSDMTQEMLETVVDQAFRRAEDALMQRLPELLAVMLHEHALSVSERLRSDIKSAVRHSVVATLSELLPGLRLQPGECAASGSGSRVASSE